VFYLCVSVYASALVSAWISVEMFDVGTEVAGGPVRSMPGSWKLSSEKRKSKRK